MRGWFKIDKLTGAAKTYFYDMGKGDLRGPRDRLCLFYDEKTS